MDVISFVNMKGGVAKTTLAVNIADDLARRYNLSVLLIDTDPQFNATQCLISGEDYVNRLQAGAHTIVDVFDNSPRVIANPVTGPIARDPIPIDKITPWTIREKFDLIPGDLELYRLEFGPGQGREQRLVRLISHLRDKKTYDFVLIDTPPTPSAWMISALLASDYYVIPVKPEPLSRTGIDLLDGVVSRVTHNYGNEIKCLGVVLTMADPQTRVFKETVDFFDNSPKWKDRRFASHITQRTEIAREQGNQTLILDLKDDRVKLDLAGVARELLERLNHVETRQD